MPSEVDDQVASLLEVVEDIRAEQFGSLKLELLEQILRLHCDPLASDTELTRAVQALIDQEKGR